MRRWRWPWRSRRSVGTVTVTIAADTGGFLDAMDRAAEAISVSRYRWRIADERRQGRAFIVQLVAQARRELGLREDA